LKIHLDFDGLASRGEELWAHPVVAANAKSQGNEHVYLRNDPSSLRENRSISTRHLQRLLDDFAWDSMSPSTYKVNNSEIIAMQLYFVCACAAAFLAALVHHARNISYSVIERGENSEPTHRN